MKKVFVLMAKGRINKQEEEGKGKKMKQKTRNLLADLMLWQLKVPPLYR